MILTCVHNDIAVANLPFFLADQDGDKENKEE